MGTHYQWKTVQYPISFVCPCRHPFIVWDFTMKRLYIHLIYMHENIIWTDLYISNFNACKLIHKDGFYFIWKKKQTLNSNTPAKPKFIHNKVSHRSCTKHGFFTYDLFLICSWYTCVRRQYPHSISLAQLSIDLISVNSIVLIIPISLIHLFLPESKFIKINMHIFFVHPNLWWK